MAKWLKHFKLDEELFIIDGENLKKRPWEELERMQRFLQVPIALKEEVCHDLYCVANSTWIQQKMGEYMLL